MGHCTKLSLPSPRAEKKSQAFVSYHRTTPSKKMGAWYSDSTGKADFHEFEAIGGYVLLSASPAKATFWDSLTKQQTYKRNKAQEQGPAGLHLPRGWAVLSCVNPPRQNNLIPSAEIGSRVFFFLYICTKTISYNYILGLRPLPWDLEKLCCPGNIKVCQFK